MSLKFIFLFEEGINISRDAVDVPRIDIAKVYRHVKTVPLRIAFNPHNDTLARYLSGLKTGVRS